ncbi:MAG: hypothetical protein U1F46_15065 [Marinagarivorans sp.]
MARLLITWLFLSLALAARSWALEPLPNLLKDWQGWVLEEADEAFCPAQLDSERKECVWPGELTLAATDKGADFKLAVDLFAPSWVILPGGPGYWPLEVKSGLTFAPVRASSGRPEVYLPKGRHLLSGRFSWSGLPRTLIVPPVGIVHLSLNGKVVEQPSLESAGILWLAEQEAGEEAQSDALNVKVFRHLSDGIPMVLTSRLELEVSGTEREVVLGPWLLEGFTPQAFASDLPAKLEPNGQLRLQLKPGEWTLTLTAHSLNGKPNLSLPKGSDDWPSQEVWSFTAAPTLRSVQVSGGASIDPSQTTMPQEWRALPAYLLEPGQALAIEELFRGNPNPPKDELRLERKLWLDFTGEGLSFRDQLSGTLNQAARLDLAKPFELLKVDVNHKPQVVTQVEPERAGVEVRERQLQLEGQGRMAMARDIPVSAWATDVSHVSWTLQLPPGWSLLHARGADSAGGSWVSQWGLFDIFVVLIIAIALGKIVRPWVGGLAFVSLVITYQRSDAGIFIWLNLAAVLALLPWVSGAFARWLKRYTWLSFASLVLILLSFSVTQVRYALYPQLEGSLDSGEGLVDVLSEGLAMHKMKQESAPMEAAAPVAEMYAQSDAGVNEEVVVTGKRASLPKPESRKKTYDLPSASQQIDPNQQTQTGSGVPKWSHNRYYLSWSGPVTAEQTTRLYWVPPWINRPGYLLAAVLPWLLAFALWQAAGLKPIPGRFGRSASALSLLLAVLAFNMAGAPDCQAEQSPDQVQNQVLRAAEPSPELLKELKNRLLKDPLCLPDCISIESVTLQVKDDSLRMELVLHALTPSIYTLPASQTSWWPQLALLNGERASLRQEDEGLELALLPGRQSLVLQGNLAGRNSLPLAFGLNINNLKTELSGWSISGEPTPTAESTTLQLTRAQSTNSRTDKRLTPAPMAPFVRIERRLQLGLEWSIETEVTRIAPATGPILLEVPLLPGEAPLGVQPNARGLMPVSLASDETTFNWTSRLKITPELNLVAPDQPAWVEEWRLETASQWHFEAEGTPQLGSNLNPRWQPWPGEQLHVKVGKPPAVKGNNLTLQEVALSQKVGQRAQDFSLQLTLLSSQGQDFVLNLPTEAKLNKIERDGAELPPIVQDGRVKLPVKPGTQVLAVHWQLPHEIPLHLRTASLDLGAAARNITLSLDLPADRWILFLGGPQMGPALLFWGVLLVVLALARGLGRSGLAHLKAYEWVLLSLGVATQSLAVLVLMAAWFAALRWRGYQSGWAGTRYKALQLGLILLSLATLGMLLGTIPQGLLSEPNMRIYPEHYGNLSWYSDFTTGPLPQAWVVSVPMWVYRVSMLAWSLWIAFALTSWLKWGWQQLGIGGFWPEDGPKKEPLQPKP